MSEFWSCYRLFALGRVIYFIFFTIFKVSVLKLSNYKHWSVNRQWGDVIAIEAPVMGCTHISRKNSCRQPWYWGWSSSIGNPSTALAVGVGQGSCEVPAELQSQPCRAKQFVCFFPCREPLLSSQLDLPRAGRQRNLQQVHCAGCKACLWQHSLLPGCSWEHVQERWTSA